MNDAMQRAAHALADHEFWLLWLFGAPLLIASNLPPRLLVALLAVVIPLLWLARRAARGYWSVRTPLDLPLILLILLGIPAVAVSPERSASLVLYVELVGLIAFYYSLVNSLSPRRPDAELPLPAELRLPAEPRRDAPSHLSTAVWILLLLGVGMAIVGFVGLRFAGKFLPLPEVVGGLHVDLSLINSRGFTPNIVGGTLAPLVPLAVGWGLFHTGRQRAFAFMIAVLLCLVIVLTQSRGALIGVAAGLAVMLMVRVPRFAWLVPLALVAVIGTVLWMGPSILVAALDSTGTGISRLELWDRATRMLADFPFTGIGIGRFETLLRTFYPLLQSNPAEPAPHAHNVYLQMGVDYGIGGLVAFVGLVTAALAVTASVVWQLRGQRWQWLALGLLGSWVVFIVHSMLDAVVVSTKAALVVWFICALAIVLAQLTAHTTPRVPAAERRRVPAPLPEPVTE